MVRCFHLGARGAQSLVAIAAIVALAGALVLAAAPAQADGAASAAPAQSTAPILLTMADDGPAAFGADDELARQCCKICRKGKACGNSCINRAYTCHRPPGCACNGN